MKTRSSKRFSYMIMNHIPDQRGGSPLEWNKIVNEGLVTGFRTEMTVREIFLLDKAMKG
jgi:hypothetical protein